MEIALRSERWTNGGLWEGYLIVDVPVAEAHWREGEVGYARRHSCIYSLQHVQAQQQRLGTDVGYRAPLVIDARGHP